MQKDDTSGALAKKTIRTLTHCHKNKSLHDKDLPAHSCEMSGDKECCLLVPNLLPSVSMRTKGNKTQSFLTRITRGET